MLWQPRTVHRDIPNREGYLTREEDNTSSHIGYAPPYLLLGLPTHARLATFCTAYLTGSSEEHEALHHQIEHEFPEDGRITFSYGRLTQTGLVVGETVAHGSAAWFTSLRESGTRSLKISAQHPAWGGHFWDQRDMNSYISLVTVGPTQQVWRAVQYQHGTSWMHMVGLPYKGMVATITAPLEFVRHELRMTLRYTLRYTDAAGHHDLRNLCQQALSLDECPTGAVTGGSAECWPDTMRDSAAHRLYVVATHASSIADYRAPYDPLGVDYVTWQDVRTMTVLRNLAEIANVAALAAVNHSSTMGHGGGRTRQHG
jgi:hypothetical protein